VLIFFPSFTKLLRPTIVNIFDVGVLQKLISSMREVDIFELMSAILVSIKQKYSG
jgi:hypothetical protein